MDNTCGLRHRSRAAASLLTALGLLLVVGALGQPPAHADGQEGEPVPTVDRIVPALPGVDVWVENGPFPLLALENSSDIPVDVLAPGGEPFLRIGPRGVLGNLDSPQWYLSTSPSGAADVPTSARPGAPPRWGRVSRMARWAWFDPRFATESGHGHPSVGDWTLTLRYDGRTATVRGSVESQDAVGIAQPRFTSPPDVVPGVTLSLLPGRIPAVFLENSSARTVLIRGRQGEAFARVGPEGTEVNVRSATYADGRRARGLRVPEPAAAPGAPEWVTVSSRASFSWLETRANSTQQVTWSIPIETGGRVFTVKGVTEWSSAHDESDTQSAAAATPGDGSRWPTGLVVVALAGLAVLGRALWSRRQNLPTS